MNRKNRKNAECVAMWTFVSFLMLSQLWRSQDIYLFHTELQLSLSAFTFALAA